MLFLYFFRSDDDGLKKFWNCEYNSFHRAFLLCHELISDDGGVLKVLSAQILSYQELDLKWS